MAGYNLVGATVNVDAAGAYSTCGTGELDWCNAQFFDNSIAGAGLPSGAIKSAQAVQKVYQVPGTLPAATPSQYTSYVNTHGGKLLVAIKPTPQLAPFTAAADANLAAFVTHLIADIGIGNFKIVLWQEMVGSFTAPQYVPYAQHYARVIYAVNPAVVISWDPNGFVADTTGPSYYPGDSYCNEVIADYYQTGYANGTRLDKLQAIADGATSGNVLGGPASFTSGTATMWAAGGSTGTYPASFPFRLTLADAAGTMEVVQVNSGAGTSGTPWAITRGQDGTAAIAHTPGTTVIQYNPWVDAGGVLHSPGANGVGPSAPVPQGLGEWGWWAGHQPAAFSLTAWTAYCDYLVSFFGARVAAGKNNAWLISFNSDPSGQVTGSNNNYYPLGDPKVPGFVKVWTSLSPQPATTKGGKFIITLRGLAASLAAKGTHQGPFAITLPAPAAALQSSSLTAPAVYAHTAIQNPAPHVEHGASAAGTGAAAALTLNAVIPDSTQTGDLLLVYCATGFAGVTWSAGASGSPAPVTWSKLTQPAGGGTMNTHDISPAGAIVGGSDTQGLYLTTDQGDTWQVINRGVGNVSNGNSVAGVAWSVTEANTIYAACGDAGTGGGLLASADGGATWVLRSSVPQFAGNGGPGPLPAAAGPRSTGRLLAQDGTCLYAGTAQQGVMRSASNGTDDFPVTISMGSAAPGTGNFFCRGLFMGAAGNLWGGFYETGTANGGLWLCSNPLGPAPSFTRITGTPAIVEECAVAGGYVYCASGGAGLWQYSIAAGTWRSLNGTAVNTVQSLWNSVDVMAVSGSHVVAITCNTPASGASFIKVTIPSAGAGAPSWQVLNPANVTVNVLPPAGQSRASLGTGLTLGGSGSKNNNVRFSPLDATGNTIFISGSNGFYRSTDGGVTWAIATRFDSAFHTQAVACDPNHAGHLILETADYGAVEITDGTGFSAATCAIRSPGNEGRCFAFDPVDSTMYAGTSVKAVQTAGGDVFTKAWNATSWTSMGLASLILGWPVTGLLAFRDGSSNKIVVAATETQGIWRWTSATSTWTQVSTAAFAAQQTPAASMAYDGAGNCYALDRAQGVFRSTDYGVTWGTAPIWAGTATGSFSIGFISANPAAAGELWISATGALLYLTAANTTPVVHAVTPPGGTAGPAGPVLAGPDGTVYLGTQDTGSGIGIYATTNHGGTWTSLDSGNSFAKSSYAVYQMAIAGGTLYAGTGNILTYAALQSASGPPFTAIPAASGTSGSAQLLYRVVDGSEGWVPGTSTVTVTASASHPWALGIIAVSQQTASFDPAPAASGQVNASATAVTAASVTTVTQNDLLIWFGFTQAPSGTAVQAITLPAGYSAPAGVTQATTSAAATSNVGLVFGTLGMLGNGATGAVAGSVPVAQASGAMLVAVPAATVTITIPVIAATAAGQALVAGIVLGSTAVMPSVTAVTDTAGNSYTQVSAVTGTSPNLYVFEARGGTSPLSLTGFLGGPDQVTVTLSAAISGIADVSCAALAGAGIADVIVTNSGSSTTATAAGTPASAGELAFALFGWGNAGGTGTMAAPFTQLDQQHAAGLAWLTTAYDLAPPSGSLLTASDTITSTAWRGVLITFGAAGPPRGGPFNLTLPAPQAALSGAFSPSGSFAVTLPVPLAPLAGGSELTGPFNLTLPAPQVTLSAGAPVPGAAVITVPQARAGTSQVAVAPPGTQAWTYLGSLGTVTALTYSFTCPGGADQLTATVMIPATYRDQAQTPGWQVRVTRGGHIVWTGKLDEPVPGPQGWTFTAVGDGNRGTDFRAVYSSAWPAGEPDQAVNQAIARGLPWVNPGIGSPPGIWLGQAQDSASVTITDLLNLACTRGGLSWYANSQPGGQPGTDLSVFPLPTAVNRLLVVTDPVARTLGGDINTIFVRYQSAADNSSATPPVPAQYATTSVANAASVAAHGVIETYVDLSSAGTLTAGAAQGVGQKVLQIYQRASFAGPFTVSYGQLLNAGGVPVDPGTDQAATVVRLILCDYAYGGEVSMAPITFIVGSYTWDDFAQKATIVPYQALDQSLSGLLSMESTVLTPITVSG